MDSCKMSSSSGKILLRLDSLFPKSSVVGNRSAACRLSYFQILRLGIEGVVDGVRFPGMGIPW